MSDTTKCPKCGQPPWKSIPRNVIDKPPFHYLGCGSAIDGEEFMQSERCRIAELTTRIAALEQQLAEVNEKNTRLRRILAHVPARVAIQAKEAAGYGGEFQELAGQRAAEVAELRAKLAEQSVLCRHVGCVDKVRPKDEIEKSIEAAVTDSLSASGE